MSPSHLKEETKQSTRSLLFRVELLMSVWTGKGKITANEKPTMHVDELGNISNMSSLIVVLPNWTPKKTDFEKI